MNDLDSKHISEINKEALKFIMENKRRRENSLPIIRNNPCPVCSDTGWETEFDIEEDGPEPDSCSECKYNYPGKEETKKI